MKFYPVFQTLCSLGFLLLIAHTEAWQQAHWPPGRVVHVRPWMVFLAWAMALVTLVLAVAGTRNPKLDLCLYRLMPLAAWGLLVGALLVATFVPGPYAD